MIVVCSRLFSFCVLSSVPKTEPRTSKTKTEDETPSSQSSLLACCKVVTYSHLCNIRLRPRSVYGFTPRQNASTLTTNKGLSPAAFFLTRRRRGARGESRQSPTATRATSNTSCMALALASARASHRHISGTDRSELSISRAGASFRSPSYRTRAALRCETLCFLYPGRSLCSQGRTNECAPSTNKALACNMQAPLRRGSTFARAAGSRRARK
jgi:hypothetical protein